MLDKNMAQNTVMTRGIRGATIVSANTSEDIKDATVELTNEILTRNSISTQDIAFAIFTLTKDLNAAFPAKFARLHCGFEMVPMMCYQELDVPDSIKMCLRVLVVTNTSMAQNDIKHIYLKGAKVLRGDLEDGGVKL